MMPVGSNESSLFPPQPWVKWSIPEETWHPESEIFSDLIRGECTIPLPSSTPTEQDYTISVCSDEDLDESQERREERELVHQVAYKIFGRECCHLM